MNTFFKQQKPKKKRRKIKIVTPQRERRGWINAALKLWSKIIHDRDKCCQWCGGTGRLGAHHIVARGITKGNKLAWFELNNGMLLCWNCHSNKLKALTDEYNEFRDKWLLKRGRHDIKWDLSYRSMRLRYGTICKLSLADIKIIYEDLKRQCVKKGLVENDY